MKLAEALAQRSDAQKRLAQLKSRAVSNARYQEGEPPAEDTAALLAEAREVVAEIERLVRAINKTNASVELSPGQTITDAIARRDALASQRDLVVAVADAASGQGSADFHFGRQMRSELRQITDLAVPELRKEADQLAQRYRELDVTLQATNWSVDLVD